MKKRIVIISYTEHSAIYHQKILNKIFGDIVDIFTMSIESSKFEFIDADVSLLLTPELSRYSRKYTGKDAITVVSKYTLNKELIDSVNTVTKRDKITVICQDYTIGKERKQLLIDLGVDSSKIEISTPETISLVNTKNVCIFGNFDIEGNFLNKFRVESRNLSIFTIIELAYILGLSTVLNSSKFIEYSKNVCFSYKSTGIEMDMYYFYSLLGEESVKMGVVLFTPDYKIYHVDQYIEKITNLNSDQIIGNSIWDIFDFYCSFSDNSSSNIKRYRDEPVTFKDKSYIFSQNYILLHNQIFGYFTISDYWDGVNRQINIKKKIANKNKYRAKYEFKDILGESKVISEVKSKAFSLSKSDANIAIYGESGVGKELFAQSIHNTSKRCDSPFIAINCSAIVENLLESEFFGYERGAFTGANKDGKQGIFELADGGTLFLDEIAEIPKHLQAKLLRVLQEKEIIRVGGEKIIPVDVRIISATNKDLHSMVGKGEFRMDLYYRLCVLPLEIPPLRERKEDIKGLLEHFIRTTNRKLEYTDEALNCILNYKFPGNIRELENCVEYLVSINKETIDYEDLPAQFKKVSLNDFEIGKSLDENKCNIEKIANEFNLNEIEIVILNIILESIGNGERIGRRKIKQILFDNEIEISEYHIRKILKNLGEKGLLKFNPGRAGITFTHPI